MHALSIVYPGWLLDAPPASLHVLCIIRHIHCTRRASVGYIFLDRVSSVHIGTTLQGTTGINYMLQDRQCFIDRYMEESKSGGYRLGGLAFVC